MEMFQLYYLGLTPEGTVRFMNANKVAKHYNWTPEDVMAYLKRHRMDPDTVLACDFPMAEWQVKIQLAAQDNTPAFMLQEMAERLFALFQHARDTGRRRDWLGEIAREQEDDRERTAEQRARQKWGPKGE